MDRSKITKEKQRRDVNNVCKHARFVICIDGDGHIENIIDRPEAKAQLVAVVHIENLLGDKLAERVLLEVGFGRTRPYASIENEGKLLMKDRRVDEAFILQGYADVYRTLFDCVEKIVVETCATWESTGDWFVKGVGYVPRGVTFTFSRKDEFLARQILREDLNRQCDRNIDKHVRIIEGWIGRYKRTSYSEKQFRSLMGVQKTAELLATYEERPRHRDELLRSFKEGGPTRALIERIVSTFNIDFSKIDPESELLSKKFYVKPVALRHLWVRLRQQPAVHAKMCLVAEVGVVDQSKIFRRKEAVDGDIQSGTSP